MIMSKNRIRKYHVALEPIFDPEAEIQDVQSIEIMVYAKNLDEVIEKTWRTIAIRSDKYDIVQIIDTGSKFNHAYPRFSEKF